MDGFLAIYATNKKFDIQYVAEDEYLAGEVDFKGGNPTQMIGSAVFRNGIMVGTLNGEETRMSLSLRPKAEAEIMLVTFPDPLNEIYKISIRFIKKERTKITYNLKKDPIQIDVTVPISLDILAIPSGIDYVTDLDKQQLLRNYLTDLIEEKLKGLVSHSQEEFKINPYNWSVPLRRHFLTIDQLDDFKWREKFPEATINVKVDLQIEGFGKSLKPPPVEKIKEGKRG